MGVDSRAKRKLRRAKNERRQAYKIVEVALAQRDQARFVAGVLEKRIAELEGQVNEATQPVFGKIAKEILASEEAPVEDAQ